MEGGQSSNAGQSGGPAPFLLKTYEMVDDATTDDIVSWSYKKTSFVVWDPPEFSRLLLPCYFKHNNFSSFIRQLNTYGFRKIDPEKWEFANENFVKDQKHLLKSIHRRKPIHSHSQPQTSMVDAERTALEEKINRLSQEKVALQTDLWQFRQQQLSTVGQLEELENRVSDMEQRQRQMMMFLAKAVNNPCFVEHLIQMAKASMDLSVLNKKRRVPKIIDHAEEVHDSNFVDRYNTTSKLDFGHAFNQDFSNKLKLTSSVSDHSMVSMGMQTLDKDGTGGCLLKLSDGSLNDSHLRTQGNCFVPERLELTDARPSSALEKNLSMMNGLHGCPFSANDADGHLTCQLNLTLGTSVSELRFRVDGKESDSGVSLKSRSSTDDNDGIISMQEAPSNNQMPPAAKGRVNDVFWEQFLTERPGSSDMEDASSNYRANTYDEQDERRASNGYPSEHNDMEQLTL